MINFVPLLFFVSVCTAITIRSNETHTPPRIDARVPQQRVEVYDNEVDFIDPITQATIPLSRVLVVDEPQEAVDRWFDWDETCTDKIDRGKITAAFKDALELAQHSSTFLKDLDDGLAGEETKARRVSYIVTKDPAFTQMFYALDDRIGYVKESFDILLDKMTRYEGRGIDGADGVRFICDREGIIKDNEGGSYCGYEQPYTHTLLLYGISQKLTRTGLSRTGASAAQAIVNLPGDRGLGGIEEKYVFSHSHSMVFCPVFFNDDMFPNIDALAGTTEEMVPRTLDHLDCRERIMIHEWLHLKFTRNIPSIPDEIGFERAAKVAGKKPPGRPRKADWANAKINCDNYAWYAIYAYWNNEAKGCGKDVWPAHIKKPNKP
ncbi:hypothetical protein MaudCBS49596_003567 [Microsporum audouinii]